MRNAGLEEAQAGIKMVQRNINNLRYADDTTVMEKSEEKLKTLLMKVKEESEKASLNLSIQKTKIMASGPITSWEIDGETMETVSDFIFGDSKITADGDCSHEIKRCLLLGRKAVTHLDNILKSRAITLTINVYMVKAMVFFSSDKNGWALKNWCFWIMVLEKTLDIPLDSEEMKAVNPKGNQPWILTGRTDAGAKAPILWPPDVKNWFTEKSPDAGKDWRQKEKG